MNDFKPIIIITGSSGHIGQALFNALKNAYQVIGLDRSENEYCEIPMDLTSSASVELAFSKIKEKYGQKIAAVIHLAAYFDFTGENNPLYESVNEEGTKRLLQALQAFTVERFIFTSTMLVHQPCERGQRIDEQSPLEAKWAYPQSKIKTEAIIKEYHGHVPYLILRLAGLYDDERCIPTLAHQIARVYERDPKSHFYAGDMKAGQAFIHQHDLVRLFKQAIRHRSDLKSEEIILAGETSVLSYEHLQEQISELIHQEPLSLHTIPPTLAKAGSWLELQTEPLIPDAIDQGEAPFIRPYMIDLASDHYALDTTKARKELSWEPEHDIEEKLPELIQDLKSNPIAWYERNGLTPPDWMTALQEEKNAETVRTRYEKTFRREHQQTLWAHFLNIGLGTWLIASPATLNYQSSGLSISDIISGLFLIVCAFCCLSWRLAFMRWVCAAIGLWVLSAPLFFWAPTASAYLNDTLIGGLIIGFAVLVRPEVGVAPNAAMTGSNIPIGWSFSPSSWFQRLPIIILAFIGLLISRYLAAYQLGHIDAIWDPFFIGSEINPKNGTEEIITSYVSEVWPVSDAGLGGLVYMLEILTGIIGGTNRWRTMPWLVLLFGILIIPLGVVSITFIIIQPILLNTWCTLCLMAAVAMLVQVPYSFDELIATSVFLWRRWRAGRPLLRILFVGDTEVSDKPNQKDNFEQSPFKIIKNMLTDGVSLPWNLALCLGIGIWLLLTRLTLDTSGSLANADHLIGSLIITVTVTACAEVVRSLRLINLVFALALCIIPFVYGADGYQMVASILCGVLLVGASIPRGAIKDSYGGWDKWII